MKILKRRGGVYEYWINAIEKARVAGEIAAKNTASVWKNIVVNIKDNLEDFVPTRNLNDLIIRSSPLKSSKATLYYRRYSEARVAGIDSSRTKPIQVGLNFVTFVSGVLVLLNPPPPGEKASIEFLSVDHKMLPETGTYEHIGLELDISMFRMEIGALRKALSLGKDHVIEALVLDGPLVDPPNLASKASKTDKNLEEETKNLVKQRATILAELYKLKIPAVGFVKRVQGRLLSSFFEEKGYNYLENIPDSLLALILRSILQEKYQALFDACKNKINGDIGLMVTKPVNLFSLRNRVSDISLYEESFREVGLSNSSIYTALFIGGGCKGNLRKPRRIEFIAEDDNDAFNKVIEISALLEAWNVDGIWLPSPVLLAHNSCTIKKSEGRKLLREVASRYAIETLIGKEDAASIIDIFS